MISLTTDDIIPIGPHSSFMPPRKEHFPRGKWLELVITKVTLIWNPTVAINPSGSVPGQWSRSEDIYQPLHFEKGFQCLRKLGGLWTYPRTTFQIAIPWKSVLSSSFFVNLCNLFKSNPLASKEAGTSYSVNKTLSPVCHFNLN